MSQTFTTDSRRARVRRSTLNGLDEVDVGEDPRTLTAWFFHDAPDGLSPAHLRISGGVSVRHIRIIDVALRSSDDPDVPRMAVVSVDRAGDASTYQLHLVGLDNIDLRYASAAFTFFIDADDAMDCRPTPPAITETTPVPQLNYLAKDYAGFRQVLLDRLAVTLPDWQESHIPDIGIMLVDLLAYVADRLSYYQDAVATEAYLGTARRRISVRRHVRLIDYPMHEGCNARALVQIDPALDTTLPLASVTFLSGGSDSLTQFQPMALAGDQVALRRAHTTMAIYTWGETGGVLPKGATSADLVDPTGETPPSLKAGDFLIFEVLTNGLDSAADPDPQRRVAVRLIQVTALQDTLLGTGLLRVAWAGADALPTDFPLGDVGGGPVTVARGNLVLVDEGRPVAEGDHAAGTAIAPGIGPGRRRTLALASKRLSFAEPVPRDGSAQRILGQRDPRLARPLITSLQSWALDDSATTAAPTDWSLQPDLIESGPDDPHATVEVDDEGRAILRFGDGVCGRDPSGQVFEIRYRVGNGAAGNVGADRLTRLLSPTLPDLAGWAVRNPLPASGGTDPEDIEQVRLLAPHAFANTPMRAITADDYAALAVRLEPSLQRAACSLVPAGGRLRAQIAIDPLGTDQSDASLAARVAAALEPYRCVGHDIVVVRGDYVPLRLVLRVELLPGYGQAHLRAALHAALGSFTLPGGGLGAFHPDNLTFGTPIYGSRLIAIAQALDGVRSVAIEQLARQFDRARGTFAHGVLRMAWYEIPQLDNDPLHPDRGRLVLHLKGGRS